MFDLTCCKQELWIENHNKRAQPCLATGARQDEEDFTVSSNPSKCGFPQGLSKLVNAILATP